MTMVAVLVVLALILVASGTAAKSASRFKQAICQALSLSCGPTDTALTSNRQPTEPCTISSSMMAGEGKVAVLVVESGNGESLTLERLSDGTYNVTLDQGTSFGVGTGAGAGVFLDTGKGTVGAGAMADASAGAAGKMGMTWAGLTGKQAQAIYNDLKPAVQSSTAGPLGGLVRDVWEFLDGSDNLRQPDIRFVQGGAYGDAGASAAFGAAGASAAAHADAVLGTSVDSRDGSTTVYLRAGIDGSAHAGFFLGPGADTGVAASGVLAVTLDRGGHPVQLAYTGEDTAGLNAQLGSWDGNAANGLSAELQRQYDANYGAGGTVARQVRMTLDLTNDANRAAAGNLLASAGHLFPGGATGAPNPLIAGYQLGKRIVETGKISVVDYSADTRKYGLNAAGKLGLELGLSSSLSFESRVVSNAQFWDGDRLVTLPGCQA